MFCPRCNGRGEVPVEGTYGGTLSPELLELRVCPDCAGGGDQAMRYMADPRTCPEQPYDIDEGIVVDHAAESRRRPVDRCWPQSRQERLDEEASWAARSGPCITLRGRTA